MDGWMDGQMDGLMEGRKNEGNKRTVKEGRMNG